MARRTVLLVAQRQAQHRDAVRPVGLGASLGCTAQQILQLLQRRRVMRIEALVELLGARARRAQRRGRRLRIEAQATHKTQSRGRQHTHDSQDPGKSYTVVAAAGRGNLSSQPT